MFISVVEEDAMKLLHFEVEGASLFENGTVSLDLIATDRVAKQLNMEMMSDVSRVGQAGSVYTLNVIGVSGVNASGKTTLLNLLRFVLTQLTGMFEMREFSLPQKRLGKLDKKITVRAIFWHEGDYYLIESHISRSMTDWFSAVSDAGESFIYTDETLWTLSVSRPKRSLLVDVDKFKENAAVCLRRNGDLSVPDDARRLLNDRTSIAVFVTNRAPLAVGTLSRQLPAITMPTEVIQAFDGSVEKLSWDPEAQVFHLKFKGEKERIVGMEAAVAMLSRGTIEGAELIDHAIGVLKQGGYFIVDEIEESLNRSLVATVIELFASPVTNPHGAQLVFSTHYPEILDSVRRKDAVYVLVRDEDWRTSVVKYANSIDRIENKKSTVINNNIIRGSMPRYPDVQAMRDYVRACVNGQRRR